MTSLFDEIRLKYTENWQYLRKFLGLLTEAVTKNPIGSARRILDNRAIITNLGINITEEEHKALISVLNSAYGEYAFRIHRRRNTTYFRRLDRTLNRFPDPSLDKNELVQHRNILKGLLNDLQPTRKLPATTSQVERLAKSTLELSGFATTWHDPGLVTATYLLEQRLDSGRGDSRDLNPYLASRIRQELEFLIVPESKSFFRHPLDDEANIWWGILTLFLYERDVFSLHQYKSLTGLRQILRILRQKPSVASPSKKAAQKEFTFEIHTEYKTILQVSNLAYIFADICDSNRIERDAKQLRDYALNLQKPYLQGEKSRPVNHLYFVSLEAEVWGRILAKMNNGEMLDYEGLSISPDVYAVKGSDK